ncbi:MAG TPA: hypothetical protein VFE08_14555 [Candidatus Sulfotelmatobacter sp.]|jgi:hypothetical protein|nr:hypothetical protein [Candidatus Sulfotelmatobacter sp.]
MADKKTKTVTLQVQVTVPVTTGENEVETALNAALDESPETGLYWDDWYVGALEIIKVVKN